jgi:hypothetical protein
LELSASKLYIITKKIKIKKILVVYGFRRIFCRCSSTIVGIAESMSTAYHMLGIAVVLIVEQVVPLFEQVETRFVEWLEVLEV